MSPKRPWPLSDNIYATYYLSGKSVIKLAERIEKWEQELPDPEKLVSDSISWNDEQRYFEWYGVTSTL